MSVQEVAFDTAVYDLPGTPKLNGRKARAITVTFDSLELDRTDREAMELVGKLQLGVPITLTVTATPGKRSWVETDTDEPGCVIRVRVEDVAA